MKKILSLCLALCMISMAALSVSAAGDSNFNDEPYIATNKNVCEGVVTKNMKTGEVSFSEGADIAYTESENSNPTYTEAWFPTVEGSEIYSANDSRSLIGEDNRVRVDNTKMMPYSAICYIEIEWSDGSTSLGTAFMIYDDLALTAGHCVYSSENGGWATNINVWPGKDGYGFWNNPYGTTESTYLRTASEWVSTEDEEYDWALIELEEPIGNETGWFGIGWSASDLTGTDVTISGYPGEHRYYQYKMSDEITRCTTNKLYYDVIDTTGGQSGSPIYTSGNIVYGIHCYGYIDEPENSGTRITEWRYNYFCSFMD